MKYLALISTVLLLAVGQVLFKLVAGKPFTTLIDFVLDPLLVLALAIYAVATALWIVSLRLWPISVAYPATAVAVVIVVAAGTLVFGEPWNAWKGSGVASIILGLVLLALA